MICKKVCGDSLTTSAGTYTFYESKMNKNDATKFCQDKGQILAPITSQGEFDKVHQFVNKCCNTLSTYHVGLFVFGKDVKMFTNCEQWDSAKHDSLFEWDIEDSPCYEPLYFPLDSKMTVDEDPRCGKIQRRPICFKAANAQALVSSKSSNGFSVSFLTVMMAFVSLGFCVTAVALFISVRKLKHLKQSLPVSTN